MRSRRDHKMLYATRRQPALAALQALMDTVWLRAGSQCEKPGCGRYVFHAGHSADHQSTGYVYSPELPMIDPGKAVLYCGPHFKAVRP